MALDATAGGTTANSFATVAEFKTYRDTRRPADATVTAATDADIEAALIAACREMEACFDWTGTATGDDQALTWPRTGMLNRNGRAIATDAIPQALKDAQCELAFQILMGTDFVSDNDARKQGIASVSAGSVSVSFQGENKTIEGQDAAIRRMGSELNYVSDAIPGEVRRLLVPSWFNQPSVVRPVLFEAFGGSCD